MLAIICLLIGCVTAPNPEESPPCTSLLSFTNALNDLDQAIAQSESINNFGNGDIGRDIMPLLASDDDDVYTFHSTPIKINNPSIGRSIQNSSMEGISRPENEAPHDSSGEINADVWDSESDYSEVDTHENDLEMSQMFDCSYKSVASRTINRRKQCEGKATLY